MLSVHPAPARACADTALIKLHEKRKSLSRIPYPTREGMHMFYEIHLLRL